MITKIWKSGNSLVVTISSQELKRASMKRDTKVRVECSARGEIKIRKIEWDGVSEAEAYEARYEQK